MKVYTHENVDLDAAASVWFVQTFIACPYRTAEVRFVSAGWDGAGTEDGDMAVDIRAGGRGIKGEERPDGTVGSCFALLVADYAPRLCRDALRSLVELIDAQDAHGQAVEWLAPEASHKAKTVMADTGLNGVLRGFQAELAEHADDDALDGLVVERMSEIFSGMLKVGMARQRAKAEADRAELIGDGRVAIVRDKRNMSTNGILFDGGVRVVVCEDGHGISVIRGRGVSLDMTHPNLLAVIRAAGEEYGAEQGKWFSPRDFLLTTGTRKGPATWTSRVRLEDLAAAAARLLADMDRQAAGEFNQPSPRTIERLRQDLRDPASLALAVLTFGPNADPAHISRLLNEEWWDARYASTYLLTALQHVQRVGTVGRDVFVQVPTSPTGAFHNAAPILARFPHVEVAWAWRFSGGEPIISADYRFAEHPLAPRTMVTFTIGYTDTPDGGENLVYTIGAIEEQEAQDPQGS
jgi:hypothetical protein